MASKPTAKRQSKRSGRARQSPTKREAIIDAATERFLKGGYLGTSVDEIAERAGVAKQTVYEHFGGKEQLFTEIVLRTIDQVGQPFFERIVELEESADLSDSLGELARELIAIVNEPQLLELRRLVIGEVGRFPKLGRVYSERGPGRTIEALAARFERLSQRGVLRVADTQLAAQQFNWLVLSIPINRAMFDPTVRFSDEDLERCAQEAVRIFLSAYAGMPTS
jgi:TetR/AcrR family transcriptional regulator, mexJK operon transcriptional repressor